MGAREQVGGHVKRLRTALIGYGMSGQTFHAPMIAATPELDLAWIVTGDPTRANLAQHRYPGSRVVSKVEDLFDKESPDLAVVATPNGAHATIALTAIAHGCGIVIDKPMAVTAEDGHALVEAARSHSVMLTVFQNRRWDSDHLTLRQLIADGTLGEIWRYDARYEFYRPGPGPATTNGLLLGLATHTIDQAIELFGPVSTVYGEVFTHVGDRDDDSFVAIAHENGVRSHFSQSSRSQRFGPRLRVVASLATFEVDKVDAQQCYLERNGALPAPGTQTEPESNHPLLVRNNMTIKVAAEPGQWFSFYPRVARAVIDHSPPPVDPASAVYVLEVIEAARRSSETKTVVAL
jgi:predicted dehydrogenase